MGTKSKEPLVRTSVQLSSRTLELLDGRWTGLGRSEALRLALERFKYFDWQSQLCEKVIAQYGKELMSALAGFDYTDFRAVARALPALVIGYVKDEGLITDDDDLENLERTLEMLEPHDRLRILDYVVEKGTSER